MAQTNSPVSIDVEHRPHPDDKPTSECPIFERGFGAFFQSGDFSDVSVVVKETGVVYDLHKIILAYSSKYFAKLFDTINNTPPTNTPSNTHNENPNLIPNPTSTTTTPTTPTANIFSDTTTNNNSNINTNTNGYGFGPGTKVASNNDSVNYYGSSAFPKKEKERIELGGPFTQYFKHVIKYMYEGSVEFTSENAIPLLAMADFYQIKNLRAAASDYLLSSITRENALMMLQKAIHFNAEEVANKCITVICKNFNQIASLSLSGPHNASSSTIAQITHHIPTNSNITLNSLPLSVVIRIVKQNNLAVASEFVVYKTVCSYIETNKATLSTQDITALFETVRFPWLTYQQLTETEENPMVPRHLLTEALFIRLKQHEAPTPQKKPDEDFPQNIRLTPRAAYAISLEYHSDFDEHGLFYYIGTHGGREEWSNPGIRGRVRITCSSQEKGNIVDLVGRTPTECWSMDVPASWVMINLGSSRSLVPNYYTLRHGGNSKADGLRNWTLQGSNDAKNWTVLIRHSNDNSLNGNFATCSWPIPNCTQAYRYFRVLQTGRNSSNHNFLSLSGIEFYGDLYETRKEETAAFI